MADDKVKIHFICEAKTEDSPPVPLIEEIAQKLVEPAIPPNIDYTLNRGDFRAEDGTLDHYTVDMMATDDLVIVDLSDLAETAHFVLGARAYKGLPIVYICDETFPVRRDLRTDRIIRYSMEDLEGSVLHLREEIEYTLAHPRALAYDSARQRWFEYFRTPRATRKFFANAPVTVRHRAEASLLMPAANSPSVRRCSPAPYSTIIQRTRLMAT